MAPTQIAPDGGAGTFLRGTVGFSVALMIMAAMSGCLFGPPNPYMKLVAENKDTSDHVINYSLTFVHREGVLDVYEGNHSVPAGETIIEQTGIRPCNTVRHAGDLHARVVLENGTTQEIVSAWPANACGRQLIDVTLQPSEVIMEFMHGAE